MIILNSFRHFSFDLWMTLIRSNPEFKIQRSIYFFEKLNSKKKSIEVINKIFRQVDLLCNSINEKTGKNIDSDEMYLAVLYLINDGADSFKDIDFSQLYEEMIGLTLNYHPVFYSHETLEVLQTMRETEGVSFSISSNTAFIKGATLREVLLNLGIGDFFDFQLYSDEINYSKPNKLFFETLINKAIAIDPDRNLKFTEIIHIGDNENADIFGANNSGLSSYQINSNNLTIKNLISQ